MCPELYEMPETYNAGMSEDDVELLEEIIVEISDSLNGVCVNAGERWRLSSERDI